MVPPKYERLESFDVVREEADGIHVLGRSGLSSELNVNLYLHHIVWCPETKKIVYQDSFKTFSANPVLDVGRSMYTFGFYLLHRLRPSVKERIRKTREYYTLVNKFQRENSDDLRRAVRGIRVYQGSLEEVSRDLGRTLERVETGTPETFAQAKDTFLLRVAAFDLGADAIVHYQPGSSTGTPVRFVK